MVASPRGANEEGCRENPATPTAASMMNLSIWLDAHWHHLVTIKQSKILDPSVETVRGASDNLADLLQTSQTMLVTSIGNQRASALPFNGNQAMTITIPAEFEGFIEHAVASGQYRSEAELFADALRLLQDHERKWDALRDDIESGLSELERGEKTVFDVEDIKRRGRDRLIEPTAKS